MQRFLSSYLFLALFILPLLNAFVINPTNNNLTLRPTPPRSPSLHTLLPHPLFNTPSLGSSPSSIPDVPPPPLHRYKKYEAAAAIPLFLLAAPEMGMAMADPSAVLANFKGTGFYQAFSLIFLSEIGDKTFFIAGLLAMKTSRLISFVGSIGALAVMTAISVLIGQIFHQIPSGLTQGLPLDDYAAIAAFTFFGLKTLKEAFDLSEDSGKMDEELADAEEAVSGSSAPNDTAWGQIASTFALVFAAEFGDRSFLATIALGAAQNPLSVFGGAVAGHAIATTIAVLGGSVIAKYISEKVIGYIGGGLFLVFALTTALGVF